MIENERRKMLAVHLCGQRVLMRLESIGVLRLRDLKGRDPRDLMARDQPRGRAPHLAAAARSPGAAPGRCCGARGFAASGGGGIALG